MPEQLELFGDSEFAEKKASPSPPTEEIPESAHPQSGRDEALTKIAAQYARGLRLRKLAEQVEVVWNHRMRTAAGRAYYQIGRIELNTRLQQLPEESRGTEIQNTFLHELAHLVSFARARGRKIQPHGPEWKQACHDLGIPGEDRCHSLNFQPRRMKRKYAYICGNCGSTVERVRKLRRYSACYECCRKHNKGQYDDRFRLIEKKLPQG